MDIFLLPALALVYGFISLRYNSKLNEFRETVFKNYDIKHNDFAGRNIRKVQAYIVLLAGLSVVLYHVLSYYIDLDIISFCMQSFPMVIQTIIGLDLAAYIILLARPNIYKDKASFIFSLMVLSSILIAILNFL